MYSPTAQSMTARDFKSQCKACTAAKARHVRRSPDRLMLSNKVGARSFQTMNIGQVSSFTARGGSALEACLAFQSRPRDAPGDGHEGRAAGCGPHHLTRRALCGDPAWLWSCCSANHAAHLTQRLPRLQQQCNHYDLPHLRQQYNHHDLPRLQQQCNH